jgi:hypothetical protein
MTIASDYLAEFMHQTLARDQEGGLWKWSESSDYLREGWQIADCRRMLREAKGLAVSQELGPATLVLVRAAEGMLEAKLGHWDRAVACYRQALEANQKAGDLCGCNKTMASSICPPSRRVTACRQLENFRNGALADAIKGNSCCLGG